MRPAEMTTKICENAPASLQVSHRKRKRSTTNFKAYATHELVNISISITMNEKLTNFLIKLCLKMGEIL